MENNETTTQKKFRCVDCDVQYGTILESRVCIDRDHIVVYNWEV